MLTTDVFVWTRCYFAAFARVEAAADSLRLVLITRFVVVAIACAATAATTVVVAASRCDSVFVVTVIKRVVDQQCVLHCNVNRAVPHAVATMRFKISQCVGGRIRNTKQWDGGESEADKIV